MRIFEIRPDETEYPVHAGEIALAFVELMIESGDIEFFASCQTEKDISFDDAVKLFFDRALKDLKEDPKRFLDLLDSIIAVWDDELDDEDPDDIVDLARIRTIHRIAEVYAKYNSEPKEDDVGRIIAKIMDDDREVGRVVTEFTSDGDLPNIVSDAMKKIVPQISIC